MKEKNITVNDIARYLNISPSTVSRALNNHPKISQKTKEKVWEAAKKLGYAPNLPAYLINSTKRTLLILVHPGDKIFATLHRPLIQKLQEQNINAFTFYTGGDITPSQMELFENLNFSGILLSLYHFSGEKIFNKIKQLDKPVFTINSSLTNNSTVKIFIDYYYAGYLAIKHLHTINARRLALVVTENEQNCFLDDLKSGINSALLETKSDFTTLDPETYLAQHTGDFDGIIATDPKTACKIYCHLQHLKIAIPQQVSIVSIGYDQCYEMLPMSLTHVYFSIGETLEKFAQTISRILDGEQLKKELIIPAKLIIKASSLKINGKNTHNN